MCVQRSIILTDVLSDDAKAEGISERTALLLVDGLTAAASQLREAGGVEADVVARAFGECVCVVMRYKRGR